MFANNAYAKVWEVKETDKVKQIRISTSRKNQNGEYETDFSGYVRLVGKAKDIPVAKDDSIQLLGVGVTNNYVKETKTNYTNYLCFEFKNANSSGSGSSSSSSSSSSASSSSAMDDGFMNIPDGIDEELPFN